MVARFNLDIQPDAMIKFFKIVLIDTGWLLDSMIVRSVRNFPVAFRAFFSLCVVCNLSFTYRVGQRATKIIMFCSVENYTFLISKKDFFTPLYYTL